MSQSYGKHCVLLHKDTVATGLARENVHINIAIENTRRESEEKEEFCC